MRGPRSNADSAHAAFDLSPSPWESPSTITTSLRSRHSPCRARGRPRPHRRACHLSSPNEGNRHWQGPLGPPEASSTAFRPKQLTQHTASSHLNICRVRGRGCRKSVHVRTSRKIWGAAYRCARIVRARRPHHPDVCVNVFLRPRSAKIQL